MSNEEAITNLVGLMTSFHVEIKALPEKLKCGKCKFVLKNAYQVLCGCRFCRACIDDVISRGDQFCPGGSQQCGATPLSTAMSDYKANTIIFKLTAKCPHAGCSHECPLVDLESHMHTCLNKNIDCPFRELGCAQSALPGEEMSGHLLQESRGHSEILIGMVANTSRDMETVKRELLLKDEQGKHLENEMKLIKDENELMKIENESIKREKEVLCDQVRQLSEKLEREIDERRQRDEQDSTMVTAVTSNRDGMEPVRDDIRSIRNQLDRMKIQMEAIRMAAGLEQFDDWLIDMSVTANEWGGTEDTNCTSSKFGGVGRPYSYQLASKNSVSWKVLLIYLRIWVSPGASQRQLSFPVEVTVTVADRNKREVCSRQTRQCQIGKPVNIRYGVSEEFVFPHVALRDSGLDLKTGVRISCEIVPNAVQ